MNVDLEDPPPPSRTVEAKRRILQNFAAQVPTHGESNSFTFQEAVRLEQEAHARDQLRQQEMIERRRRMGLPIKGEQATPEVIASRIHAFMNFQGSDSEGDDEDWNNDDDDPAAWFEDDQDDGRKGQDIIEPDYEDLSNVIRIDDSRIAHNVFYEPNEGIQ